MKRLFRRINDEFGTAADPKKCGATTGESGKDIKEGRNRFDEDSAVAGGDDAAKEHEIFSTHQAHQDGGEN